MTTDPTPQDRVEAEAEATIRLLTVPNPEEPFGPSDVYDYEPLRLTGHRYLLGGGGPTTYATVLPDGDHDLVLISVDGWGERAHRVIAGAEGDRVAKALQQAKDGRP